MIALLSIGSLLVSFALVGWVAEVTDRERDRHVAVCEANAKRRADYERETAERLASGRAPKPPPCYKVSR